jgi:hypothetical protein
MAKLGDETVEELRSLKDRVPELSHFFRNSAPVELSFVGFRVDAVDEQTALKAPTTI